MVKEQQLVGAIIHTLQILEGQHKVVWKRVHSGVMYGSKYAMKSPGSDGFSDFVIFAYYEHPVSFFIECKANNKSSKQSPNQYEFEKKVSALGFDYYIIKTIQEFDKVMLLYGISLEN
jgi:hypothetical protein